MAEISEADIVEADGQITKQPQSQKADKTEGNHGEGRVLCAESEIRITSLSEKETDNNKDVSEGQGKERKEIMDDQENDGKKYEQEIGSKKIGEEGRGSKEISDPKKGDSEEGLSIEKGKGAPDFSTQDYELIDGEYHYTDISSGVKYRYSTDKMEWVEVDQASQQVTTDSEGRTYYYADGLYLCRDSEGNVFFMDEKNEWRPWEERTGYKSGGNDWYFYQGSAMFYRDRKTGAVFKFNKEESKWEKFEGKLKRKRPNIDPDEEFDTDEDEGSDDEESCSLAPPGAQSDPSIKYDGVTYTKMDPNDKMEYEWDVNRRAWFPKVRWMWLCFYIV